MEENKIVVYAYVVGDIIHIGHLNHLKKAKGRGDYLIVGVLTDEATMEKKPKPIIPFKERLETIKALRVVDEAIPQETYSPIENVKRIKPNILMESESHAPKDIKEAKKVVESYGGEVIVSSYYSPQSSTAIKNKINNLWNKKQQEH